MTLRNNTAAVCVVAAALCWLLPGAGYAQDGGSTGGQIVMNVIEIKGKVERPQAVYIINLARPEMRGIKLERDFLGNVKDEDFSGISSFSVDGVLSAETFADEPVPVSP